VVLNTDEQEPSEGEPEEDEEEDEITLLPSMKR
jgi:hypothetical protein